MAVDINTAADEKIKTKTKFYNVLFTVAENKRETLPSLYSPSQHKKSQEATVWRVASW